MLEELVLNPVEFTPELPEISLEALGLSIAAKTGPDYGESSATVERVRQDISEGATNSRWPPVECTIPLIAKGDVDLAIADPLHRLEAWVADVQRRKMGWVRRDFSTDGGFSGFVAAFVDSAALTPAQGWSFVHQQVATGIALKFTRYPIWFATVEIDTDAEGNPLEAKGSGVRDLQLELADLLGTAPGLITVRLKNEGIEDWRGCYVSLECDDYSAAPTALPRYGAAELTLRGGAMDGAGEPPEIRGVGAVAAGTGPITPGLPAGTVEGDLLIMVAESGGATAGAEANTALTASGWTLFSSEKKGNTRLTVLYRIAAAANPSITNDTGDHQLARIIGIKAGTFHPLLWNAFNQGTQAATKAVSVSGATPVRDGCLILACASGNLPDATTTTEFSAAANASLTGVTERIDNTTTEGDGGAIWAVTGVLATAGNYGATTGAAVTEAERATISIAISSRAERVKCPPLTTGWVTVLSSEIAGIGHMTHVGPRKMVLEILDPSTELGDVQWKLEWRTLGAAAWSQTMVTSTPVVVSSPVLGDYQLLDFGEARPERPVIGDPRFEWRLQGRSISGSGKQPLIRDVYPMSTEQWARVSDTSENPIDGEPTRAPLTLEDATGVGTVAWSSPSNAGTEDEKFATAEVKKAEVKESHYLKATNFGFELPTAATPLWIAFFVRRRAGTVLAVVEDKHARVVKGGVVKETQDKARSGSWAEFHNGLETVQYGGAGDLWGQSWTAADINATGFGFALSVRLEGLGEIASLIAKAEVDAIMARVVYSESANTETHVCFADRSIEFTDTGVRRQHITDETWGDVPAPEGVLLKAPAPGQADRDARLLVVPSVGDFATRANAAAIKAALKYSYRPGYLHAREAAT